MLLRSRYIWLRREMKDYIYFHQEVNQTIPVKGVPNLARQVYSKFNEIIINLQG